MHRRVDVHFHLLPGLDDGPATIEESVDLARMAVADGTRTVVATPHVRRDFVTSVVNLPDQTREVQARLARDGVPLQVLCGAELGSDMVGGLDQSELETVALGPPGGRWLLVETPFSGLGADLHAATEELRDRGFGVVLAHPERSAAALGGDGAELRLEVARGTLLQVNASSLAGDHGPAAEAAAALLVSAGLAEAVASDAHSRARAPALERGLRAAIDLGIAEPVARRPIDLGPRRLVSRGVVSRGAAGRPAALMHV